MAHTILEALHATERLLPDHAKTLLGQRPRGSQWGPDNCPRFLTWYTIVVEWEEVPHDKLPPASWLSFCRYFRTVSPFILRGAVERVAILNELPAELQAQVSLVKSAHGYDLVLPAGTVLSEKPAEEAWVILGPASKEDPTLIVWTTFPGRLAAGLDPGFDGQIASVDFSKPYAVKVL